MDGHGTAFWGVQLVLEDFVLFMRRMDGLGLCTGVVTWVMEKFSHESLRDFDELL
jgi:hypothetical protein